MQVTHYPGTPPHHPHCPPWLGARDGGDDCQICDALTAATYAADFRADRAQAVTADMTRRARAETARAYRRYLAAMTRAWERVADADDVSINRGRWIQEDINAARAARWECGAMLYVIHGPGQRYVSIPMPAEAWR